MDGNTINQKSLYLSPWIKKKKKSNAIDVVAMWTCHFIENSNFTMLLFFLDFINRIIIKIH